MPATADVQAGAQCLAWSLRAASACPLTPRLLTLPGTLPAQGQHATDHSTGVCTSFAASYRSGAPPKPMKTGTYAKSGLAAHAQLPAAFQQAGQQKAGDWMPSVARRALKAAQLPHNLAQPQTPPGGAGRCPRGRGLDVEATGVAIVGVTAGQRLLRP